MFPTRDFDPAVTAEYNRQVAREFERIRDFLVLHYRATERDDSAFWRDRQAMEIPDTLAAKMAMFRLNGRLLEAEKDLFHDASWLAVMLGQGVIPAVYDPLADIVDAGELGSILSGMREAVRQAAQAMPSQRAFIAAHCAAGSAGMTGKREEES